MAEIFVIKKDLVTNLGTRRVGEKLYRESYDITEGSHLYYPMSGGYPIWDVNIPVLDYAEFVEETNNPKEYYINKVYSQFEMDEAIKNLTKSPFDAVPLSGSYLLEKGWTQNGNNWQKEENKIRYDGTYFWLNGSQKIQHIQDIK